MNLKKPVLLSAAIAALLVPQLSRANGDPVVSWSASIRACNPVPRQVSDVQIVKEDLQIDLGIPYATVTVRYRLRNKFPKAYHIDYGFPIDFDGRYYEDVSFEWTDDVGESLCETGLRKRDMPETAFFALNGKRLDSKKSSEILRQPEVYKDENGISTFAPAVSRIWNYTAFDIPAGSEVELMVKYTVLTNWSTPLYLCSASPISRHFPTYGAFYYDFTPAQHWGNGKVTDFNVTVNCATLPTYLINGSDSPQVFSEQLDFKRKGNSWTAHKQDFDLASAKPLTVNYWEEYSELGSGPHPCWGNPISDHRIDKGGYTVKASSAQAKYPVENMSDSNLSTAWVAEGDGNGSVIDIHFTEPVEVSDLAIYNGYHKSAGLLTANSRIRKLKMEVIRADGFREEPVEVDLYGHGFNESYSFRFYGDNEGIFFQEPCLIPVTNIHRKLYGRETGVDEDGCTIFDKVDASKDRVSDIRLTVLEVDAGSKYNDLCVSELIPLNAF